MTSTDEKDAMREVENLKRLLAMNRVERRRAGVRVKRALLSLHLAAAESRVRS